MATLSINVIKMSYDSWIIKNSDFKTIEEFQYWTHCTSLDRKIQIQTTNILKKHPTPKKWEEPLSRDDAPHGVWFGITMKSSSLPTMSPFGTERVLKPVDSLRSDIENFGVLLYLEAIRFQENITNVRLILLKEVDKENIDWCEGQGLYKLDIHDNPFLTIEMGADAWIWRTWKNDQVGGQPATWVALFIADDVDVSGCEWDTVEKYILCTNCNQLGHGNPECPLTKCFRCRGYGHWADKCPL